MEHADASKQDLLTLGKAVRAGAYVKRSTFIFALIAVCVTSIYLGYILSAMLSSTEIPQNGQSAAVSDELLARIASLEKGTLETPKNPDLWRQLAHAYYEANMAPKSIAAYETLLSLAPPDSDSLDHLGNMYRADHQHEKAQRTFQTAVDIDPKDEKARFYLGVVYYFDMNDQKRGMEIWQELLRMNPDARLPDGASLREWLASTPK